MSTPVLTGPFLDFGQSYWGTAMMREELPGLQGKGFESTGRYGIGFFSVFMWGGRVKVTTRRYRDAIENTQVLEFKGGLEARPLLRKAEEVECLDEGGTRVRVWLKQSPGSLFSDLSRHREGSWTLEKFCVWLCPTLDASLYVEQADRGRTKVITASDWRTMDGHALCHRLWVDYEDRYDDKYFSKQIKAAENYSPLKDSSGEMVGRASLTPYVFGGQETSGLITVGGFRTSYVLGIAGVLVGNPTRAARDLAIPVVSAEELQRWASEQAILGRNLYDDPRDLLRFTELVRGCGGNTGDLPIAACGSGWLSLPEIARRKDWPEEILLIDAGRLAWHQTEFMLEPGVIAVQMTNRGPYVSNLRNTGIEWPPQRAFSQNAGFEPSDYYTLRMAVVEALAKAWGASLEEVLRVSFLFDQLRSNPIGNNRMPGERRRVGKMWGEWGEKKTESYLDEVADVVKKPGYVDQPCLPRGQ